jgi:uncharacterized membrane protein
MLARLDSGISLAKRSSLFHRGFVAAIAIKGLDGAIELVLGVIVAVMGSHRLYDFIIALTTPDLPDDPISPTAHFIQHGASGLAHASNLFVVTYLLAHGVIKLAIAINLLRERSRWIFPAASVLLTGFIAFMSYRLTTHWSAWLLGFALFDLLTLALVLNEWRNFKPARSSQT